MARYDAEAFHFPEHPEPLAVLREAVEPLYNAGRYRSALDAVLERLRTDGMGADPFWWALALLRSRADDPANTEPVTASQRENAYFTPIATECQRCEAYWYSSHVLHRDVAELQVSNPVGLQCQECRYTLCRHCLPAGQSRCPAQGCPGGLGLPVLPTGRPRGRPANRHTGRLEQVLVLWHGQPVDAAELEGLVDVACTWQDRRNWWGYEQRVEPHDFTADAGFALIARQERDGSAGAGALQRTRTVLLGTPRGQRMLFVTAAPEAGAPEAGAPETGAPETGAG
ncbi:hypothetical protein GCM10009557_32250 [Virgisporangium ochraceum]|uniref:Uncharacterized protein n=1 Tax=Virgisporangium ochraceum TaxID=65505 RepID=A0A8J4EGP6_9ACTN|nr:hypothetical protein [Virgisporangium ochraceum]GIJ75010.1 hypothetical protein Voc01_099270 [Virgisporangium ochraceum]